MSEDLSWLNKNSQKAKSDSNQAAAKQRERKRNCANQNTWICVSGLLLFAFKYKIDWNYIFYSRHCLSL